MRDEIEQALRSWNRYEIERGAPPVIDFDCHPVAPEEVPTVASRLDVRDRLVDLASTAAQAGQRGLVERLTASVAYLDEVLGAQTAIRPYIAATQGCPADGWTDEYLDAVRAVSVEHLAQLGVSWGANTLRDAAAIEGSLDSAEAPDVISKYASMYESNVRRLAQTDAPFELSIEHVDLDEYWAYWLDGAGHKVRMRINRRNAMFTDVQARQFALHEILGHGLQCASYSQKCAIGDVPWVRLTAVHAQQQVLLEGLAQALPLLLGMDDDRLIARVRLAHYLELVRGKLHLAVNDGVGIAECVKLAQEYAPFWRSDRVGDALSDRGANPLLRSYLWSYPAGIDWFINLADLATKETIQRVVIESYREPLTPEQLSALWPEGSPIGGNALTE